MRDIFFQSLISQNFHQMEDKNSNLFTAIS